MFQNVLITALTPNINEVASWENRPFSATWPEEDRDIFKDVPTKLKTKMRAKKRFRTQFRTDQLQTLEETFTKTKFIDKQQRTHLSSKLMIDERCIKVWFQNRRMKYKKEKESSDLSDNNSSTSDYSLHDQSNYENQYYHNNYQGYLEQQPSHSVTYTTSPMFFQQADSTSQIPSDYLTVNNVKENSRNDTEIETFHEQVSSTHSKHNFISEDAVVEPKTEYCQETEIIQITNFNYPQEIISNNEVPETQHTHPSYMPSSYYAYNPRKLESALQNACNDSLGVSNEHVHNDFILEATIYPTQFYSSSQDYSLMNNMNALDYFNSGYNLYSI